VYLRAVSRRPDRTAPTRPIAFAHRGASALAPENTLEAFRLAVALGATGLESDVHVSRDGAAMLVHDDRVLAGVDWIAIRDRTADELESIDIPRLASLYAQVGAKWPLSLDLNDADPLEAAVAVMAAAADVGPAATEALLLCHGDRRVLEHVRRRSGAVRLVHSTAPRYLPSVAEHAGRLADLGIDVVNLHWEEWGTDREASAAVEAVHRAGLRAFAWDTQTTAIATRMVRLGIDGIYADDPRVLVDAIRDPGPA
jgi:glycerophosphoryl diester phosphodiesterase